MNNSKILRTLFDILKIHCTFVCVMGIQKTVIRNMFIQNMFIRKTVIRNMVNDFQQYNIHTFIMTADS